MSATESLMITGTGTMGTGIAQVAATAGVTVMLYDTVAGAPQRSRERIAKALDREIEKGRLTPANKDAILGRLQIATRLEEGAAATVVIEAVKEDLAAKQELFRKLEALLPSSALLLSNTSMISITDIADGLKHPERVAGCHFFNPVPRMALVEVVAGAKTSPETLQHIEALVTQWGKTPVRAPNTPGFIVNRALFMMLNEGAYLAAEGTPAQAVDQAMKLGCNLPMGPLELMDLIGLDISLACLISLHEQFGHNRKYEPCPLLKSMVASGKLGRKSGEGFYKY